MTNTIDDQYLSILRRVLDTGFKKENRTGVDTIALPFQTISYDMTNGFPLLTTRSIPFKSVRVELEGFLNGVTDKQWYKSRGCHLWDQWSNPSIVDQSDKQAAEFHRDLGPLYGYQWRSFNKPYTPHPQLPSGYTQDVCGVGSSKGVLCTHKLYKTWSMMLVRCYDSKHKDYPNYGGSGVYVCDRWLLLANFIQDVGLLPNWDKKQKEWDAWTLDKDQLSGFVYSPKTCLWASKKQQGIYRTDVRPIIAISPNGDEKAYDSFTSCAKENNLDCTDISRCISGEYKSTKGWTFRLSGKTHLNNKSDNKSVDQLKFIVDELKSNPNSRRMVCSAWNPNQLNEMALPPCHLLWQVTVIGGKVHLTWFQRSCDLALGVPSNIASYALLLLLLSKEAGLPAGTLNGVLNDAHVYVNHIDGLNEQLKREPRSAPKVEITSDSIWNWTHEHVTISGYHPHPKINMGGVAV